MGLSARVYTRRATIGPPNHGATSWPGRGSCGQQRRQVGHQLIARIKEQGPLAKGLSSNLLCFPRVVAPSRN